MSKLQRWLQPSEWVPFIKNRLSPPEISGDWVNTSIPLFSYAIATGKRSLPVSSSPRLNGGRVEWPTTRRQVAINTDDGLKPRAANTLGLTLHIKPFWIRYIAAATRSLISGPSKGILGSNPIEFTGTLRIGDCCRPRAASSCGDHELGASENHIN